MLQLDALLVEVVVVSNDATFDEDTLTCNRIRRVQLCHIRGNTLLQRFDAFIDGQVLDFDGVFGDILISKLLHGICLLLPLVVKVAEVI